MVESIIFMVTGLLFDACGAVMIINPWINLHHIHEYRKEKNTQLEEIQKTKNLIIDYKKEINEYDDPKYVLFDNLDKEQWKETSKSLLNFEEEDIIRLESNFKIYAEYQEHNNENKIKHSAYWGLSFC